ncbi:MAG: methylmalonyl-CoA mutase [Acidobacteria bacterium]|nr:MAG: methylmalonyl-CoA mutase [Acidobacteriota bacterium]
MSDAKTKSERKERFTTLSGLTIDRLYTEENLAGWNPDEALGYPGLYPFTRGIYPTMYRGRFWTMRQYAGFGTAVESNQRYRYLLSKGQAGLSVAFDLPTQIGLDSDHPLALGEVGKVGVAIDSLEDMETLFAGIPLEKVSTSMTINATAAILLCLYVAVAKRQGASLPRLSGTIQNDVLKEYIARGTYIYPVRPAMRIVTDIFAWCRDHLPKWNIEEIAKYRAARRLWAGIMAERFGAKDPRSMMLRFHAQTAGSSLTAQQPENNIVRVAIQALAAVLGGCQSLHTNSLDEALALPTEDSALIALRTQQILANETGVANTVDPVAGSYAIESLTNEIESQASHYLTRIDKMGGMLPAIEAGYVQGEIQKAAYEFQQAVEKKEQIVVGVNDFVGSTEGNDARIIPILRIDAQIERSQIARLAALRAKRDTVRAKSALAELQRRAATTENLLPAILAAVEAYATVGEISDALRRVFGEYLESVVI